ncbi:MAG: ribonuclease Y [Firmicutes bacterium]|jgi:ribonuclease Y|nr:ribonuclease Y [Bacillota bacterium]NLO66819.1 ribonuclease Y [Bacillota bacterium]
MTVIKYAVVAIVASVIGYFVRKIFAEATIRSAEEEAARIIQDGEREAESLKREALVEAREEIHKSRSEMEREARERRNELQQFERRLTQKEEALDRRGDAMERREETLQRKFREVEQREIEIDELLQEHRKELERLSQLTTEEARELLLKQVEDEVRHETAMLIREIESQAKEEADKKARDIISLAIQRTAADHVAESTVSVVSLPNDDMKGRIIGREGRNIRALETLTGIDLIIDDTPEAVILSGFDPVRREVARIALERLIADGRIHPARIEEMVEKARREVDAVIRDAGEQATLDADVHGLHPEIVKLLGRLKFRTSYGQNVLQHSIEVAHLAGIMASELRVDARLAKRAGLLHDLGKAVDHEIEGTHVEIGIDLLRKYNESEDVIHAMACHHGDYEPQSVEAVLVMAADSISAARPGARRETLESYIKRLQKLEDISSSFKGVEKSYAIQAGREVRIIVKPDRIDDAAAVQLSRDIVKKIEAELEYPGQIKVTVIRETRAVEYAK